MKAIRKHSFGTVLSGALVLSVLGAGLIWLGDGHVEMYRKSMVVLGVGLTLLGIGLLRYLLYSGLRKKDGNIA